jgi:hypothetical protein
MRDKIKQKYALPQGEAANGDEEIASEENVSDTYFSAYLARRIAVNTL